MNQRTSIGLDVHARSVVACGLDGRTGELFERRLTPAHREIFEWIRSLPDPVKVTYEAGPTGFGLARFLATAGIECLVAAPSKLQRPPGDRVKNDARDARHLARLLHLGQIVEVAVPSVEQEAARDLVRAREDCRGDLMAARHRVSKLLLRHGIVYYGGHAWTKVHDTWLRTQHFDAPGLQLAYETAYDTMLATVDRRDRLDVAIAAMANRQRLHPGGDSARLPARRVHADRVRAGRRDRRLAAPDRTLDRRLPRARAHRTLIRRDALAGIDHQDRQRPRAAASGRGRLAPSTPVSSRSGSAAPVGAGQSCGSGSRSASKPAPARPLGRVRRPS